MTKRNLIISDLHIPDHNQQALSLVYRFIKTYKPTTLHILGDFINFPTLSSWPQDPHYHTTLSEEISEAYQILKKLCEISHCEVLWYEGNHENRLLRYLARNAAQLALLEIEGEQVVSIPHLFKLRELCVKYIEKEFRDGVLYHHGQLCRAKSGYTAHGNMEKTGVSVLSGHVHRLALVFKSLYDKQIFGMETGCLCNQKPYPYYGTMVKDWSLGWATIDVIGNDVFPRIYPIINGKI